MPFPAVWKYWTQQQFHNIAKEVISAVTVMLTHPMDNLKSIASPNNAKHKRLSPDLLPDPSGDLAA
jgi:hypothetical protein